MKKIKQSPEQKKTTTEIPKDSAFKMSVAELIHDTRCNKERFKCFWNAEAFDRCAPGLVEYLPSQTKAYISKEIGNDSETSGMKKLIVGLKLKVSKKSWNCLMSDLSELFCYYK